MQDNQPNNKKEKNRQRAQSYLKYSGMAMQMGIIILIGVFAGQKLDEYFGTDPYLMVFMSLFSIFAALYSSLKDFL